MMPLRVELVTSSSESGCLRRSVPLSRCGAEGVPRNCWPGRALGVSNLRGDLEPDLDARRCCAGLLWLGAIAGARNCQVPYLLPVPQPCRVCCSLEVCVCGSPMCLSFGWVHGSSPCCRDNTVQHVLCNCAAKSCSTPLFVVVVRAVVCGRSNVQQWLGAMCVVMCRSSWERSQLRSYTVSPGPGSLSPLSVGRGPGAGPMCLPDHVVWPCVSLCVQVLGRRPEHVWPVGSFRQVYCVRV